MTIIIHPTAVVETTNIGEGTYIGPFTYITKRVKIGKNCIINNASIGLPGEHPEIVEDHGHFIEIADNVTIREYVTINTPLFSKRTFIGAGSYLMAKSHVGHDASLGKHVVLHTGAVIGGHSTIGDYCYLGLNCSTHPFARLDSYCIVGANGIYKGKSPSALVWVGVPAVPIKINMVGLDRHCKEGLKQTLIANAEVFLNRGGTKNK